MAFRDTAEKLQKVAEMAEDVYKKLSELREQAVEVRETVNETKSRVDRFEAENAEQRAILEAIAEEQGVDLDATIAQVHISEAEDNAAGDETTDADADASSDATTDDA